MKKFFSVVLLIYLILLVVDVVNKPEIIEKPTFVITNLPVIEKAKQVQSEEIPEFYFTLTKAPSLDICWDYGIAKSSAKQVHYWKPLVLLVLENNNFVYITDPILVLSVIAKESLGNPNVISNDQYFSVGLMQINPLHWRPDIEYLSNNYNNIEYGLRILEQTSTTYDSIYHGLGAYNCGYTSYDLDNCFDGGGSDYADIILECWYPTIFAYESLLDSSEDIEYTEEERGD